MVNAAITNYNIALYSARFLHFIFVGDSFVRKTTNARLKMGHKKNAKFAYGPKAYDDQLNETNILMYSMSMAQNFHQSATRKY